MLFDEAHKFLIRDPKGDSGTFNPAGLIGQHMPETLRMFQAAVGCRLDSNQEQVAAKIAKSIASEKTPTVLDLVQAWGKEPSLVDFAEMVSAAMLPK